jgi:hypothetical protein
MAFLIDIFLDPLSIGAIRLPRSISNLKYVNIKNQRADMKNYKPGQFGPEFKKTRKDVENNEKRNSSNSSSGGDEKNPQVLYWEPQQFKDPLAQKIQEMTNDRTQSECFRNCIERAATQGLPNGIVKSPRKVKARDWTAMLIMQWLCRYEKNERFEDDNPDLLAVTHFRRYGVGVLYEFKCTFSDFNTKAKRSFWIKYLPLSRSDKYKNFLKTQYNWYMDIEKFRNLETMDYNSDDEFEFDSSTRISKVNKNYKNLMKQKQKHAATGGYPVHVMKWREFE